MNNQIAVREGTVRHDVTAGIVVFFVALPLCLGVALASGAPLLSGIASGIVGGILVGVLSGSQTSVSGPSPAPAAIIAGQITALGYPTFLLAGVIAGVMQIILGLVRAGFIARFFPTCVIKGLLAAVGLLLIFKQLPHLVGHDEVVASDMSFQQANHLNTFSEFFHILGHFGSGAAVIGVVSITILIAAPRIRVLNKLGVPAQLVVIVVGTGLSMWFERLGGLWVLAPDNLVQIPIPKTYAETASLMHFPDFKQWSNLNVYTTAFTLAAVTSLETLLSLEAVDKIDPYRRHSPASRELLAQGVGNTVLGMIGGIPLASAIVRSSVNINAGARTKRSTIFHGVLLAVSISLLPQQLNMIPLSCLAAILIVTGVKLARPVLFREMWEGGRYQFAPFVLTVAAILFTDLLTGIIIGLAISCGFILNSSYRRPIKRTVEKHLGGDVLKIELANQVSFMNRAAFSSALDSVPQGGHLLLDATHTDYIDPDVLAVIRDFISKTAPVRQIEVSLRGFRPKYKLHNRVLYPEHATYELRNAMTPDQVLELLKDGHARFRRGEKLTRDLGRQVKATAGGQHPLAVILSCIDSRAPAELIFDLGVGDVFNVRIAGNVTSSKVLGSIEYACAVAGAKLVLVMGHTQCGAIKAAIDLANSKQSARQATGCDHIQSLIDDIDRTIARSSHPLEVDDVAKLNVERVVGEITKQSRAIGDLIRTGELAITGAVYDLKSGDIEFLDGQTLNPDDSLEATHSS